MSEIVFYGEDTTEGSRFVVACIVQSRSRLRFRILPISPPLDRSKSHSSVINSLTARGKGPIFVLPRRYDSDPAIPAEVRPISDDVGAVCPIILHEAAATNAPMGDYSSP